MHHGTLEIEMEAAVREALGEEVEQRKSLGTNEDISSYLITTSGGARYFVKAGSAAESREKLSGEGRGLQALGYSRTIRVPEVYHCPSPGSDGVGSASAAAGGLRTRGCSVLLTEALEFSPAMGGADRDRRFGEQLAALHSAPLPPDCEGKVRWRGRQIRQGVS